MKKLAMLLALVVAFSSPVFAWGGQPANNQWSELFEITPQCNAEVGNLTTETQTENPGLYKEWEDCYNCKREEWARKWSVQFDIDKYSALCPN